MLYRIVEPVILTFPYSMSYSFVNTPVNRRNGNTILGCSSYGIYH